VKKKMKEEKKNENRAGMIHALWPPAFEAMVG